jgi:hypothetical protein
MYLGLHVKYRYCCQILMKLEVSGQIFEKYSNIKFHANPSSGSRIVSCGQTDRHEADSRSSQFLRPCLKIPFDIFKYIRKINSILRKICSKVIYFSNYEAETEPSCGVDLRLLLAVRFRRNYEYDHQMA